MLKKILFLISLVFVAFATIGTMLIFSGAIMHESIFLLCFVIAFALMIISMLIDLKKSDSVDDKIKKWNLWLKILFAVYCIFLDLILFFYGSSRETLKHMNISWLSTGHFEMCNIIPFSSIIEYFERVQAGRLSITVALKNIIVNLILFMPMGFFFAALFKKINNVFKCLVCVFAIVLLAEIIQFVSLSGVFDVDDIILNCVGAVIAYLLTKTKTVNKMLNKIKE